MNETKHQSNRKTESKRVTCQQFSSSLHFQYFSATEQSVKLQIWLRTEWIKNIKSRNNKLHKYRIYEQKEIMTNKEINWTLKSCKKMFSTKNKVYIYIYISDTHSEKKGFFRGKPLHFLSVSCRSSLYCLLNHCSEKGSPANTLADVPFAVGLRRPSGGDQRSSSGWGRQKRRRRISTRPNCGDCREWALYGSHWNTIYKGTLGLWNNEVEGSRPGVGREGDETETGDVAVRVFSSDKRTVCFW